MELLRFSIATQERKDVIKMTTVEARENFSELINQAAYGNERIILTRRGKALVAVVSLEDLQRLNQANAVSSMYETIAD